MKFKVGDKVLVITGEYKGKTGEILKIDRDKNKAIVKGINIVKKHNKPSAINTGGIEEKEAYISMSNIMHIDPKTKKRTRVGFEIDKKGNKTRIAKGSGEKIA